MNWERYSYGFFDRTSRYMSEEIQEIQLKILQNNRSPERDTNLGTCEYGAETPKYATANLGENLYLIIAIL